MVKQLAKKLPIIIASLAFVFVVCANRSGRFGVKPFDHGGSLTPVTESTTFASTVVPVKIGLYIENVYDFNLSTQSLAAEGVVWITWPQAFQDLLDAEDLTVEQVVTPVNKVNSWDSILKPFYAKPIRLPDGNYHQIVRFGGRFYVDLLDLHRYPFEKLSFPVIFGMNVMSDAFRIDRVRLVPDVAHSGVGSYVDITGFITDSYEMKEYVQRYPTDFGYHDGAGSNTTDASQVRLEVDYRKSWFASVQQLILPLLIVMLMVLAAPNLAASLWDVRIAIPSTALLTLVFLQQSYRQNLPLLPYLTYLDQIYGACYIVTFGLFALFVWTSNQLDVASDGQRSTVLARLNKVDAIFQWGCIIFLITAVVVNALFPIK